MPLGSRSLEHYPLHLPCQHLNEGDDDANAHDPLAIHEARCCQGLHFGCLHMTMSLVSPPPCCRDGDEERQAYADADGHHWDVQHLQVGYRGCDRGCLRVQDAAGLKVLQHVTSQTCRVYRPAGLRNVPCRSLLSRPYGSESTT